MKNIRLNTFRDQVLFASVSYQNESAGLNRSSSYGHLNTIYGPAALHGPDRLETDRETRNGVGCY